MNRLSRSPLLLTLIVVACSSTSDRQFTDEACYSDVAPPPWATLVDLAIFDQNGQPVCAPAHVTGQQGPGEEFVMYRASRVYAELFPNGHHGLRWGASCNAYEGVPVGGPESRGLFRCSDPLNWRVEAEGCEPARGSWSWNDNTFPGRVDISFHVTVRLRCNGVSDGGVGADASTDAGADASADASTDASFRCPAESLDALFSRSCAGLEGTECRYGYTVPACGGRTQTCRAGRWEEIHTDPQSACFDAGRD